MYVSVQAEKTQQIATWRFRRLKKSTNVRAMSYILDLVYSLAIPLLTGVVIAVSTMAVLVNVAGAATWIRSNIYSEQVLTALGTMLAFIVSLRLSSNLNKNSAAIGHFGNLAGVCLNLSIWSRSLVTSGKDLNTFTLLDGFGGYYNATEIGSILASIPYIVKYTYRGTAIRYEELPLGGVASLLPRITQLTQPTDGRTVVSGFTACVMLLGEEIDGWEARGSITGHELATMFAQLSALTNAEGSIGGLVAYSPPNVMSLLLYTSFFAYYVLLIVSDLGPNNEWSSVWIVGVLIVSNVGLYALSNRYSNPFLIHTGNSTQKPLIAQICRDTETAIAGVYNRARRRVERIGAGAPSIVTTLTFK